MLTSWSTLTFSCAASSSTCFASGSGTCAWIVFIYLPLTWLKTALVSKLLFQTIPSDLTPIAFPMAYGADYFTFMPHFDVLAVLASTPIRTLYDAKSNRFIFTQQNVRETNGSSNQFLKMG